MIHAQRALLHSHRNERGSHAMKTIACVARRRRRSRSPRRLPRRSRRRADASPHTFTGNVGALQRVPLPRHLPDLRASPRSRAASTTRTRAASTLGNWNSNISWLGRRRSRTGGSLEMDFYGGWKRTFGDFGARRRHALLLVPGRRNAARGGRQHPKAEHDWEVYVGGQLEVALAQVLLRVQRQLRRCRTPTAS